MVTTDNLHIVIPTIRPANAARLVNTLHGDSGVPWAHFHVVQDQQHVDTSVFHHLVNLYSWDDYMASARPIFSRHDSSCRSFGFLQAWRDKSCAAVLTIDDDCTPEDGEFVYDHIDTLNQPAAEERWAPTIEPIHSRGLPYRDRTSLVRIDVSHGGVLGVPDLSAVDQLAYGDMDLDYRTPQFVVPKGKYFPMCGMNLAFTRRVLPLMLFAPGGEGQPLSRWDDIWCGVLAKRIMDIKDYRVHCGHPNVRHIRASDPFRNLEKEAPGMAVNETFWKFVDSFDGPPYKDFSTLRFMREMGSYLANSGMPELGGYFQEYGISILYWCSLLGWGSPS